ncbi:SigE family RNA polymerase sigma factor [Nocardioides plantarum]|uniref:SigE family RNA polymerase sigma factor n=1 Tax=Nocardioides plantarum TaxID=29299 RepID=A0ABV5K986_9ACTN|nr:SigE family RNA polymerase sigma factor [Nocardioides plantarum]
MDRDTDFSEYAAARWLTLVRAAVSLGCSLPEAEDVAQSTLVKCYLAWGRVSRATHRDAYVSQVLLNTFRESVRRRSRRPETSVDVLPEVGGPDEAARVDAADALSRALSGLSVGQREVVALTYYVRLTEAQVAEVLGIAPGTVKSRLSRALATLAADSGLAELRPGGPS